MAYVLTLANQKGGVGKTTTAVNLAAFLGKKKKSVLVIDLDPQGNATSGLGIDDYDFIIIDCPPSLSILTINALTASNGIIIPIQGEYYALEGLTQLIDTINIVKKKLNKNLSILGVVLTMFDRRTQLTKQVQEEVENYFGDKVFDTVIPRNVRLAEAPSHGVAILDYDKSSKGAKAYESLAAEVIKRTK